MVKKSIDNFSDIGPFDVPRDHSFWLRIGEDLPDGSEQVDDGQESPSNSPPLLMNGDFHQGFCKTRERLMPLFDIPPRDLALTENVIDVMRDEYSAGILQPQLRNHNSCLAWAAEYPDEVCGETVSKALAGTASMTELLDLVTEKHIPSITLALVSTPYGRRLHQRDTMLDEVRQEIDARGGSVVSGDSEAIYKVASTARRSSQQVAGDTHLSYSDNWSKKFREGLGIRFNTSEEFAALVTYKRLLGQLDTHAGQGHMNIVERRTAIVVHSMDQFPQAQKAALDACGDDMTARDEIFKELLQKHENEQYCIPVFSVVYAHKTNVDVETHPSVENAGRALRTLGYMATGLALHTDRTS